MFLELYSIRDAKAEAYGNPFTQKTKGEALRSFMTAVNDPKTTLHQYPEDFDLYQIGTWNDQNGKIDHLETPKHLAKAIEYVENQ